MSYGRLRRFDEDDYERMNLEADRVERIRDYVPAEEFDETTAKGIAHQEIAPHCDKGT